jgi:hypothetical protein
MAAPTHSLTAHCAGLTLTTADYPAGSKVIISTGKQRGGSTVRVNKTFQGSLNERVAFPAGETANTYSVQLTAAGIAPVVLKGTLTSCTPRYANQQGSVVPPPAGW